jgi:hypothetical protein
MADEQEVEVADTRVWAYGPGGQSQIFNHEREIPEGWHDHPSKVEAGLGDVSSDTANETKATARPAITQVAATTASTVATRKASRAAARRRVARPASRRTARLS